MFIKSKRTMQCCLQILEFVCGKYIYILFCHSILMRLFSNKFGMVHFLEIYFIASVVFFKCQRL